ncbi:hypothetical protein QAD02_013740 [Eretmocerus hayati]|uniref:Uncharacterized protein n=1 Tax=Eretmocerus hayati TaxID=131215 RepID=A0ACC2P4A9_9HYME|nr:hypothetical protein QAD02_013740 [Eretmocerus hayati]
MNTIRNYECSFYECLNQVVCGDCYKQKLLPELQCVYSLTIHRCSEFLLGSVQYFNCVICGIRIPYERLDVLTARNPNGTVLIDLLNSAALSEIAVASDINISCPQALRTHNLRASGREESKLLDILNQTTNIRKASEEIWRTITETAIGEIETFIESSTSENNSAQ